ncbi:uncharacterized protein CMU_038610 [Cryptosporidium muris RN66]|uniref:rRNA biogenesis protein RRP36 n=1 Tax=Cryptosporidium muris (strain RN66) TaxID=441375 RepID=B6A9A3_CRYMR|nr:uncharacterized protein CMU_038610 [Cryptosporidium muris RN66]EEA04794.1 hypothetical protein, conserved [Cryptosporidium muris RN66]|eukprot:XP_002139143.1 hypothetical protein [Cryptosporidium muris RN66]
MNQDIDELSLEEILRSDRKSIISQNKSKFNSTDPRFKDVSGNLNIHLFQRSYEFLDNMREKEIEQIKENLKLYRLMERSKKAGTWYKIKKRSEFRNSNIVHMTNEDYENLNKQLQRYVGEIDRRNTIRLKQEVISQYRKEENKRIQKGKKPYFLKKKDINILAYKCKYNNLDKKRKRNLEEKRGLKQKIKFKPPVRR